MTNEEMKAKLLEIDRGVHVDDFNCECSDCLMEHARLIRISMEEYRHPDYKWKDNEGNWHSIDGEMIRGDF